MPSAWPVGKLCPPLNDWMSVRSLAAAATSSLACHDSSTCRVGRPFPSTPSTASANGLPAISPGTPSYTVEYFCWPMNAASGSPPLRAVSGTGGPSTPAGTAAAAAPAPLPFGSAFEPVVVASVSAQTADSATTVRFIGGTSSVNVERHSRTVTLGVTSFHVNHAGKFERNTPCGS
jgi:hypothetical protein